MKQALARILCLSTVLLLLNSIIFSFLLSESIIPPNKHSKSNETKLIQKSDTYSMLFNENEELDSFDDDEDEKEFHTIQLFVTNTVKLYYSLISDVEIIHCYIPEKPTLKPVQIWLQTRKLII